jgi:NAD-dependent oxidoreductase involved in siderophore biosynthesis
LAIHYGYKVEVLESYIFERGKDVLKGHVVHMAEHKDKSKGAQRDTRKFLLNTIYGKLGMKNIQDVVRIVTEEEYNEIITKFDVIDAFKLTKDQLLIKHNKYPSKIACEQSGANYEEEIMKSVDNDFVENSTPVAAAIAS